MTKTIHKSLILILIIISSCKKDNEPILVTDYKVIELDYEFDNYNKNIKNKANKLIVKEQNIVIIDVDKNGRIIIENNSIEDSLLIPELKKYIIPNPENNKMPMTIEKDFKFSGKVLMTKNLMISAKFNEELDYKTYSKIRNKIYLSFNEVRNEFSLGKFNQTFEELLNSTKADDFWKWGEIKQIIPIRYTEFLVEKQL